MPKVSKQYFADKKMEIIQAAVRVCEKKPAYEATLRDVVRECGISTGGIYNYFSSMDEILVEILNQAYSKVSLTKEIDEIFKSDRSASEILYDVLKLHGRISSIMYGRYGKFIMELDIIFMNDHERGMKMISASNGNNESDYYTNKLIAFINENVANGVFCPIVPTENILLMILTSGTGINKIATMQSQNAYRLVGLTKEQCSSVEGLVETIADTVITLLNEKRGSK